MEHPSSGAFGAGRSRLTAIAAAGFVVLGLAGVSMALPSNAYAYDHNASGAIGTVKCLNGKSPREYYVHSVEDAKNCMEDMVSTRNNPARGTKIAIDLSQDWNTKDGWGRIDIPEGIELTVNLNGHVLNRGLAGTKSEDAWWGTGSGEAFILRKNATLVVNGGDTSISHPGTLSDNDHFWKMDLAGTTSISGGLITGAANDDTNAGGAITMYGENSKVVLNNVTVAGNVRDNYGATKNDGAGVNVYEDNSTLTLNNAKIMYNHAEGYGGGINVAGDKCTVNITKGSEVSNNYTSYYGGGINHRGKDGSVNISGGSYVSYNQADSDGGGIYDYYNGTSFTLDASDISNNTTGSEFSGGLFASGGPGCGGGVYLNDVASLTLKNGATISGNNAYEGGGVYVNDDDTTITLEKHSKIQSNIAARGGAGVYMNDDGDKLVLKSSSSICDNQSNIYGGGVFCHSAFALSSTDQTVQLEGESTIKNNKANIGAGVYVDFGTGWGSQLDIRSEDGTGVISGNSGVDGAGVFLDSGKLALDNLTLKNNAATGTGGAVYQVDGTIILKGKVTAFENTAGAVKNNIAFSRPMETDESKPLAANSRIGVSHYRDTEEDVHLAEDGFLKEIGDKFEDVVIPDNLRRSVSRDDRSGLYLIKQNSKPTVTIYGTASEPSYERVEYESTCTLETSKYQKEGYILDYWTVDSDISDGKLVPKDGKASFKMPGRDITVRAHYARILSSVQLTMRQEQGWDQLGDDPDDASVNFIRLYDIEGENFATGTASDAQAGFTTEDVTVTDLGNGKKKATYTVKMKKVALESFGMCYDKANFKDASVEVRSKYNTAKTDEVEAKADDDGNLIFKFSVTFTNPEAAVTIDAVSVNKVSAEPFDTVVQEGEETSEDAAASAAGMSVKSLTAALGESNESEENSELVAITAPDEPGWEFVGWDEDELPDGIIIGSDGRTLLGSPNIIHRRPTVSAKYKPLVSAVYIGVDTPKAGEEFPTSISSCYVAGGRELDLTDKVKDCIKVYWTNVSDGSPATGTAVEGASYKVYLTVDGAEDTSYIFGTNSSIYTIVNGVEPESVEYDLGSKTGSIKYYTETAEDDSYDGVLYEYQSETVCVASQIEDELPVRAMYKLKNGDILTAPVEWDTSLIDVTQESGLVTVYGIFEDDYGDQHQVSIDFYIVAPGSPEATYEYKNDGSGIQTVSFGQGEGWDDVDTKYTMYYRVFNEDEVDGTAIDRSTFDEYTPGSSVEIKRGQLVAAYSVIDFGDGVTKDTGLDFYGRSLEGAKVSVDKTGCAYSAGGATPDVTVTLDGETLKEGVDYSVDYRRCSKVGLAGLTIESVSSFFSGEKSADYKVKPAKVKGVKAKASGKKKVKVSWAKRTAQTDGFQVAYAASKAKLAKGKGKTATVKGAAKKSYTAKSLKSGKKYFFKVRAYKVVNGKTYYSAWSAVKAAKAK